MRRRALLTGAEGALAVPYMPLGQIVQKTALRRIMTEVRGGSAEFYTVDKA